MIWRARSIVGFPGSAVRYLIGGASCQGTAFRRESPTLFLELWGDEALSTLASTFLFMWVESIRRRYFYRCAEQNNLMLCFRWPGFYSKADQEFSVFWGATGSLYSLLLMPESHSTDGRYRTSRRPTSLLTNRLWEPLAWAWRGKSILSLSEPWLIFIL